MGNWVLVNSGYNYHKFKDGLNEIVETNEKRFSIQEALFLYQLIFFTCNCWYACSPSSPGFPPPPLHKGFFTLYTPLWIILTLHLLFIWDSIWVSIPSDTSFGPLWVVITRVLLFRCLLHVNAARKVVTVYLMWWQQLFLRSFVHSSLLFKSIGHILLSWASWKVSPVVGI